MRTARSYRCSASIHSWSGACFPSTARTASCCRQPTCRRCCAGVKLVEDRRFDEHHGVDPYGIVRALWANLRAGRVVQGGSTLTQQLVKNYFLSDEQTIGRKATEAVMALRLEAHFSKEDILVAYLNEVYLGQDGERAIHGFGLGSEYYFAKPLAELDVGELALLIGLVKGPSYYDPRKHADRARARRNLVLQELADAHLIDSAAAKRAAAESLGLRPPGGGYVPAYLDLVRRHLKRDYAEADLAAAGLAVYTTFDPRAQAAAERALARHLSRLDAASRVHGAHLEGAVIVAEPNSGDVVAVVGGREAGADGLQPSARCASADRLAGEARHLPGRTRDRPLQRSHYARGRADRTQARRRQHLGAAELHPRNLRLGADGARARRVDESRDRAAGARHWPAADRRYAAAARARGAPDTQSVTAAGYRGDDAARGRASLHIARKRRFPGTTAFGACSARRARPAAQEFRGAGRGRGAVRLRSTSWTEC